MVVDAPASGTYRLLDDEKAHTRLGQGVAASGRLSDEAITRTLETLRRMVDIAEQFDVEQTRAVATSAVRVAKNGKEFVARAKRELGLDIEVISEQEEGRLAFVAAAANFDLGGRVAVMDIGGGSLEIIRATGNEIEAIWSLPIGAVTLSELFVEADPLSPKAFKALRSEIRRRLAEAVGAHPVPVTTLVGSGGTITALANMATQLHDKAPTAAHSEEVSRADVVHLLAMLKRQTLEERRQTAGLTAQRADIIVAGLAVVDEVMRLFGANTLRVNARGIREGLILDTISAGNGKVAGPDRMRVLLDFARRCRFDRKHSLHVTKLALSIFDQLAAKLGLSEDDRPLLEAAGILHDVGYYIAYDKHHKHSYHLISYASLPGFTRREQEIVASIARYHRGALPRARHDGAARLSPEDRRTVARLGAILRLADGLDRGRSQRVAAVEATLGSKGLRLTASGDTDLRVEVYGARMKGDLFEKEFGVPVDVST